MIVYSYTHVLDMSCEMGVCKYLYCLKGKVCGRRPRQTTVSSERLISKSKGNRKSSFFRNNSGRSLKQIEQFLVATCVCHSCLFVFREENRSNGNIANCKILYLASDVCADIVTELCSQLICTWNYTCVWCYLPTSFFLIFNDQTEQTNRYLYR